MPACCARTLPATELCGARKSSLTAIRTFARMDAVAVQRIAVRGAPGRRSAAISKALSDAPRELDRLLCDGRERVSVKSGETAAAPTKPSPELLRVCQDAANQTASFRLSVSPDAETDPEAREDAQALATLYQRYRTSLGTAGQQLAPLSRTPAPQDETATIRSALTALSDVVRARADWMARLNRDLERRTPSFRKSRPKH